MTSWLQSQTHLPCRDPQTPPSPILATQKPSAAISLSMKFVIRSQATLLPTYKDTLISDDMFGKSCIERGGKRRKKEGKNERPNSGSIQHRGTVESYIDNYINKILIRGSLFFLGCFTCNRALIHE